MGKLVRFGVSMDEDLLKKFDHTIKARKYESRSKALIDLVHETLKETHISPEKKIVGTITFVFDHHKRELSSKLTDVQHHYHELIVSSQHVHLNHHDCLEIIVLRGRYQEAKDLADKIRALKGVEYANLNVAVAG